MTEKTLCGGWRVDSNEKFLSGGACMGRNKKGEQNDR
jgi:hypothetical protein